MAENIDLTKEVKGVNTFTKAVDTRFTELITDATVAEDAVVTVEQFFQFYETLFFDIPIDGNNNSHKYLVERSQQYIGGAVIDQEKQALIEEINNLKQQIIELSQTYLQIGSIV